jgi:hypothetical protein
MVHAPGLHGATFLAEPSPPGPLSLPAAPLPGRGGDLDQRVALACSRENLTTQKPSRDPRSAEGVPPLARGGGKGGRERLDEKASLPAQSYDGCKGNGLEAQKGDWPWEILAAVRR